MSASDSARPRVAVLGLGTMGGGMAHRLLDQGFAVDVWGYGRLDVSAAFDPGRALAALVSDGLVVALSTPAAAPASR